MNFETLRANGSIKKRILKNFNPNPIKNYCANLACGNDYRKHWANIDLYAEKADFRINLEETPWAFKDNYFDYVYADQIIEHLPLRIGKQDSILAFIGEILRILKPNGKAFIGFPDSKDKDAYINPTHTRIPDKNSILSLDKSSNKFDLTVNQQARYSLKVLDIISLRRLRISKLFDSSYHLPKYFNWFPNIGKSWGIIWIIQKV